MHSVIKEDSPKFADVKSNVDEVKPRVHFSRVAEDIKDLIINHNCKGHIIIDYPHDQMSNVVYALKRRNLTRNEDYNLTRSTGKCHTDPTKKVEQIIITPLTDSKLLESK